MSVPDPCGPQVSLPRAGGRVPAQALRIESSIWLVRLDHRMAGLLTALENLVSTYSCPFWTW